MSAPAPGEQGGEILYSGPLSGLAEVPKSQTRRYLFARRRKCRQDASAPAHWLKLRGVTRNNLDHLDVDIPLGVFTSVTGISGSGKSSLISQFLVEAVGDRLGHRNEPGDDDDGLDRTVETLGGEITEGLDRYQAAGCGRPKADRPDAAVESRDVHRSFRSCPQAFAATKQARARRYDAGRFSFNVAKGRCETCQGEGFVCVELLFLPSVYAPCPTCKGARYNAKTLEIKIREKSIADVLAMTVDGAFDFFRRRPHRFADLWASFGRSAWDISGSARRPPSFPAARLSASNSPPNCNARSGARRSTCSTNPRPVCIRRTWRS